MVPCFPYSPFIAALFLPAARYFNEDLFHAMKIFHTL